ncbi:MAG: ABC transporter permease [Acidimicrobiia bacterium]
MIGFLVRRASWGLVTLLLFVTLVFFLVNTAIPYDYASQFRQASGAVREELGLDRPLWVQYLDYMGGLVRGDLGDSFGGGTVTGIIWSNVPTTLLIFAIGAILAYLLGSWLGRLVAWHRNRVVKGSTTTLGVLAYTAFPPWLVFLLVYFLTQPLYDTRLAIGLPSDSLEVWRDNPLAREKVLLATAVSLLVALVGAVVLRSYAFRRGRRGLAGLAVPLMLALAVGSWHLLGFGTEALDLMFRGAEGVNVGQGSPLLAILAFVLLAFGEVMFIIRTGIAGEVPEDYVFTARAKGVPERAVRDRHVARNALLPALSRFVTGLPYVLTGLIIIERELQLGGLSSVLFRALEVVDVPLITGTLVVIGVIALGFRLVLEFVQAALDPRIRYSGEVR